VTSERPSVNVQHDFVSTYDRYRVDVIDLTGDGIEEIVLVSGFGRGTSVRKEYLEVFRVRDRDHTARLSHSR